MNNYKFFTLAFLIAIFAFILSTCLLVILVDTWDLKGIVGITSPKIDAYDPRSVHFGFQPVPDGEHRGKSLNVIWMKPEAAIFGSSVAAEGFNPDNSFWNPNGAFVAYNYGISGLSIREMEQHFEHIQALKPIKKLLIVLDFFAFNALKPAIAFEQVKILPFAHRPTYREHLFQIGIKTALSLEYIKANLHRFRYIDKCMNFFDGFPSMIKSLIRRLINPQPTDLKVQKFLKDKQSAQSEQSMISVLYLGGKKGFKFEDEKGWSSYEAFKGIIKSAQKNNAEIILLIPPCHAEMLEIIHALGLWDAFIEWKRTLVKILNEIATSNRSCPLIPLWGFNYHNVITMPPFGSSNETGKTPFFSDPIHFNGEVGDYVFSVIYGTPSRNLGLSDTVGVCLNQQNIEKHLQKITEFKKKYQNENPEFSQGVKDLVNNVVF